MGNEEQIPLTKADVDIWNELWNAAHDVHYKCFFEESCAAR